MSDADPDDRGEGALDGIEPGRWLIRLGGENGPSLADRLAERFQRLTWRTPIHTIRLKGRYPLKLLAVPDDPLPGDVARGRALLDGRLMFQGEERDLATLDLARPDWSRPFGEHLHGFDWLRDLSTVTTRARAAPIAETLMARWLAVHGDSVAGEAWRPSLWGRRLLAWTSHAPLILSSSDLVYRSSVLHALARGARHLDRGADKATPGASRVVAWAGVIVAGLLIPNGEPRRAFGEAGLARALGTALFDDGGTVSRSPRQLLAIIETLVCLRAAYAARRLELPEPFVRAMARMVPALLGVSHSDQGLSSWQGGGPTRPDRLAEVIAASGIRARPLRQARDWGYQRLAAGSAVGIVDAAPPPVARVVDGGCASTLAFEFSDGPMRLVVNCGGARAGIATLPAALVEGLRTTAAHSTLCLADTNSTAIQADGTLGRGVGSVELGRQESGGSSRIEASHDGYVRRFGFIHRRTLVLTGDGRELRGEDMLLPQGRRRRTAPTPFAVRFHLGAGVDAAPTSDGLGAILRGPGAALWQFRCRGGALAGE
ncbi:heparinase II/III family protein, partial [Sphingomonas bacterium]|uniref:heparinase II/III family protein n=1 Tax=Sphingomonas bacterium TaxID=1895847 RepID=UPI0015751860